MCACVCVRTSERASEIEHTHKRAHAFSERFSEALPYARKRKEPSGRDHDARGEGGRRGRGRGRGGGHQPRNHAHAGAVEQVSFVSLVGLFYSLHRGVATGTWC